MPGLIRLSHGEGRELPKLTVWILAVVGWGFDVSSTIFVDLVCKVQLNIVFNGLRVPDFQRHTKLMAIHVSLASRAQSDRAVDQGQSPAQKPWLAQP